MAGSAGLLVGKNSTWYDGVTISRGWLYEQKEKDENGNNTTKGNEKENIKLTIEDIEKGNIGVTTTADMINQEIDLQSRFNVYEIIARMFFDEFCLHVAYTNQLPY